MTKRDEVVGFLGAWVVTNVAPGGHKAERDLAEAKILAETCVALAAAQGLSRDDLEAEVGDLDEHMRKAQNIAQRASEMPETSHPSRAKSS